MSVRYNNITSLKEKRLDQVDCSGIGLLPNNERSRRRYSYCELVVLSVRSSNDDRSSMRPKAASSIIISFGGDGGSDDPRIVIVSIRKVPTYHR